MRVRLLHSHRVAGKKSNNQESTFLYCYTSDVIPMLKKNTYKQTNKKTEVKLSSSAAPCWFFPFGSIKDWTHALNVLAQVSHWLLYSCLRRFLIEPAQCKDKISNEIKDEGPRYTLQQKSFSCPRYDNVPRLQNISLCLSVLNSPLSSQDSMHNKDLSWKVLAVSRQANLKVNKQKYNPGIQHRLHFTDCFESSEQLKHLAFICWSSFPGSRGVYRTQKWRLPWVLYIQFWKYKRAEIVSLRQSRQQLATS